MLANVRWNALWEWSQILSTEFARAGYPTVCVETTGITNPDLNAEAGRKVLQRLVHARAGGRTYAEYPENLNVYSPVVAPPTLGVFRRINQRVLVPRIVRDLRRLAGPDPVVMAFTPTQTTLDLLSKLDPRLIWYHCVLNYEEIPGIPRDIRETEQRLLNMADIVTVDSAFLKEKHRHQRSDIVHIESGANFELFQKADTGILAQPAQTVCYFGAADERRFDFDLVRGVAEAGFTVRMVGTLSDPTFARIPGIDYRGAVPHKELPNYLRDADALIIPYKITAFSKGTFPAKTYECLATGKPVVATPLPDLKRLDEHIYLGEGAEEFVTVLRRLHDSETPERRQARVELARENSWKARVAKFEEVLWQKIGHADVSP